MKTKNAEIIEIRNKVLSNPKIILEDIGYSAGIEVAGEYKLLVK